MGRRYVRLHVWSSLVRTDYVVDLQVVSFVDRVCVAGCIRGSVRFLTYCVHNLDCGIGFHVVPCSVVRQYLVAWPDQRYNVRQRHPH